MDATEQLQLQMWLDGLLLKLKAGETDDVIKQLEIALNRIEEDQDNADDDSRRKSKLVARSDEGSADLEKQDVDCEDSDSVGEAGEPSNGEHSL